MKDLIPVTFPFRGLHVASPYSQQPPGTTPLAVNVRGVDPRTTRDRGGQRAGMSKFMAAQVVGNFPVQCVDYCVTTAVATDQMAGQGVVAGASGAKFYTAAGAASGPFGTGTVYGMAWDASGNVYLGTNNGTANQVLCLNSAGTVIWTATLPENVTTALGMDVGACSVWVGVKHDSTHSRLYQLSVCDGTIANSGAAVYSATHIPSAQAVNWVAFQNNVVVLAYIGSFDVYRVLDGTSFNQAVSGAVAAGSDLVDVHTDGNGHFVLCWQDVAGGTGAWLQMWDAPGGFEFTVVLSTVTATSACFDYVGQQIIVVYSTHPNGYDLQTVSAVAGVGVTGSYLTSLAGLLSVRPNGGGGFLTGSGNFVLSSIKLTPPSTATTTWTHSTGGSIPPRFGLAYLATGVPSLAATGFSVRGVAVSGGTVVRFNANGPVAVVGGPHILDPGATVIYSAQMFQQLYFADGLVYHYYDGPTDSVKVLTASSGILPGDNFGDVARLVTNWRNRLVWSGLKFDPLNWFMSAVGDATNYNYSVVPVTETMAVSGNNSAAGLCQDIVTALIPYSDEILIFGGSRSIFQMDGDPAQGGRLDLVTDAIGMAFGRPYCRDGVGNLYFVSSRGSIYQFAPGSMPLRLSDPIAQLVTGIDLTKTVCRMAWDERLFGFHVWFSPLPQCCTTPTTFHYFYDTRTGTWWQDAYPTAMNPFAVCEYDDGNPAHRFLLLGGMDGYLRKLDVNALDDDGTAINSYVWLPLQSQNGDSFLVSDLQCTLDETSGGVTWTVYGARSAQKAILAPEVTATGTFTAGRNRSQALRVYGSAAYLVLASNQAGSAWALEELYARVQVRQTTRERVF